MILLDANLLLYAYDGSSRRHRPALEWLEKTLSGDLPVCLTWQSVLAFLRIATHPGVFRRPLVIPEAVEVVESWFDQPCVRLVQPTERHWSILRALLPEGQVRGPLVMDAHLAALAMEHGAVLHSTDRDFSRFPGLRRVDPLGET